VSRNYNMDMTDANNRLQGKLNVSEEQLEPVRDETTGRVRVEPNQDQDEDIPILDIQQFWFWF